MTQKPTKLPVTLREVADEDLPVFFGYLQDPHAQSMAASTFEDYSDPQAFTSYWAKLRRQEDAIVRTITVPADAVEDDVSAVGGEDTPTDVDAETPATSDAGRVAGHISIAPTDEGPQVRYWVDRPLWGRGVATGALREILDLAKKRPIIAQISRSNEPGAAVLLNNGFSLAGEDTGFDNAKGRMIDELIYRLE